MVGVGGTWGVWGAVTRRGTLEVGMGSMRSYPLAVLPQIGAKRRAGKYMSHVRPGWGLAQLPAWGIGPGLCSKEKVARRLNCRAKENYMKSWDWVAL